MHHLSHLTNDYVSLWKVRAPSSTLKVPFHTFCSGCYYNRPEDVGALRGGERYIEKAFRCISNIEAFQHLHHSWPFSHLMAAWNLGARICSVLRERKISHLTASKQNMF